MYVYEHTAESRLSVIHTGRGMGDNIQALADGIVDIAIATPAPFADLALRGVGPFEGRAIPELRAIATLPHHDAMVPVARKSLGLTSLSDLRNIDRPLTFAMGVNDPNGLMGFAADAVLEAAGLSEEAIVAAGGTVLRHEQPFAAIADYREGRADIMISEAIMTPDWIAIGEEDDSDFLSLTEVEESYLEKTWGLKSREIEADYFPNVGYPVTALDYGGWIILTTTALPDDVAALLATAIAEDSETFVRGYSHLPVRNSPLHYPIDFRIARKTPIPLHPGAEAVYDAAARA
ncbi:TAXI family TRAP transporter solute-binding subunit [Herbiconiux liukaitaii]|uniref:TAXI family TRAP transporter solute-binding subunit n=1 Tax=Herbiconiux liukaitaii TaxID=3342799 RepID=UPI0035B89466